MSVAGRINASITRACIFPAKQIFKQVAEVARD